jgi:hypothetical protein
VFEVCIDQMIPLWNGTVEIGECWTFVRIGYSDLELDEASYICFLPKGVKPRLHVRFKWKFIKFSC